MLDSLSVGELAMLLLLVLVPLFLLRFALQARYVDAAPPLQQAGRQFRLELSLFLVAGMVMALVNYFHLGFPMLSSGSKLVLSLGSIGLYAAIDLSLQRERSLIQRAKELGPSLRPPESFAPLTRKFSLVACILLVLIAVSMMLLIRRDIIWIATQADMGGLLGNLQKEVIVEVSFVMGALLLLTIRAIMSYSANLQLLFRNETTVLEQVSNGDLKGMVPVLTNDEFGFIAGHTNSMIEGLRDRMRMRQGLILAREVQQNLLPASAPHVRGVAIHGRSHFSDETGGDFYDFFESAGPEGVHVGMVLGDVSGHGVGPALLMASARAMFRMRMGKGTSLEECMMDVNSHLTQDLFGSGRFMTVFSLLAHKETGELTACVAGHDPGIVYNPAADSFSEFGAQGLALGVEAQWRYETTTRPPLEPGELLVLGTDGIWEAREPGGEMFGKQRLRQVIRDHARSQEAEPDMRGPAGLEKRVMQALARFCQSERLDDDVTLVVLEGKATSDAGPA